MHFANAARRCMRPALADRRAPCTVSAGAVPMLGGRLPASRRETGCYVFADQAGSCPGREPAGPLTVSLLNDSSYVVRPSEGRLTVSLLNDSSCVVRPSAGRLTASLLNDSSCAVRSKGLTRLSRDCDARYRAPRVRPFCTTSPLSTSRRRSELAVASDTPASVAYEARSAPSNRLCSIAITSLSGQPRSAASFSSSDHRVAALASWARRNRAWSR